MKAQLCILILALFQNCYGTPTLGAIAGLASAASGGGGQGGAGDCEDDSSSGHGGNGGSGQPGASGHPGGSGLPGVPGFPGASGLPIPSLPAGAGLGALSLPGASSAGCLCGAGDNPDCSPITGFTFAQPSKIAPGGVGTIALAAPQLAIIDKAKSELAHGIEAAFEAATHADVDKTFQIILNSVDKVAVRAGQLIDTIVPGVGSAAIKVYSAVSVAAHVAAKTVSKAAVTVSGGEGGLVGGGLL